MNYHRARCSVVSFLKLDIGYSGMAISRSEIGTLQQGKNSPLRTNASGSSRYATCPESNLQRQAPQKPALQ